MVAIKKRPTQAERRLAMRDSLWEHAASMVWNRKTEDGYTTIPRILPLVMRLINHLSNKEGDASQVYFELWCRASDEGFVQVGNPEEHAYASGYITIQRGVRSWRERVKRLNSLGFIRIEPHGMNDLGFILLIHPHIAVEALKAQGKVPDALYNAFLKRLNETGAEHKKASPTRKARK